MSKKPPDVVLGELTDSLAIIAREISQLASFRLAWQSLAVQLYKILCDGDPPLVQRVIPDPLFHPMRSPIAPNTYQFHMGCKVKFNKSGVVMSCFDDTKPPIPLPQWLNQIILVSNGQDLTVCDVVRFPRIKEAAHSDPKEYAKIDAMKNAYTVVVGGKKFSSYHLTLAIVGAYVLNGIRQML